MAISVSRILDAARSEIGTKASSGQICKYNTSFYGSAIGGDWCCAFIWDRFHFVGADSLLNGKTANCGQLALNFKKAGRLYSNKSVQVGDIVLFHWSNDKSTYVPEYYTCDHVGIVESVNGDTITTIEGNTDTNSYPNGIVARKTRSISKHVSCVCKPAYSNATNKGKIRTVLYLRVLGIGYDNRVGQVKNMQRVLRECGYKGIDGKLIVVDGEFGLNCEYAIKEYQKNHNLPVTGIFDERTQDEFYSTDD